MGKTARRKTVEYPQPRGRHWVCSDGTELTDRVLACRYEKRIQTLPLKGAGKKR